ncbi:MAG: 3-deoxy-7-phosphoheptulonate synthase [Planctomycetota bacterium]|nr:MAG: 3-deoxy-7-phosphoheptulonate synthase [Planctomycetota bacterium]
MWIELASNCDEARLERSLRGLGLWTRRLRDDDGRVGLWVEAHSAPVDPARLRALPGVAAVLAPPSPHPRVDGQRGTVVEVAGVRFGGEEPVLLAGPCAAESPERMHEAAALVARAGGRFLRGGAFKPRTSPYAFAGHGRVALGWVREAADAHGLGVVCEVLSEGDAEAVAEASDLVQIGSRNMQNFALLRAVGACGRPVLLKRGMGARLEEWLLAGEHLLAAGSGPVLFCERGVRGFDPATRNLLDLGAVATLAHGLGQPVVVDPSHAAGRRDLVLPLGLAGLAAGACGLLVEVHPEPEDARSDGPQALRPVDWAALARAVRVGAATALSAAPPCG